MNEPPFPDSKAKLLFGRVAELYSRNLNDQPLAKRHLTERGLTHPQLWEHYRLGYCDGTLSGVLPAEGEVIAGLTALGVLDAAGQEFFKSCIVCPVLDEQGHVTSLAGWPVDGSGESRRLPGDLAQLWNLPALKTATEVFLTTSIIDGLSVASCELTNVITVVDPAAPSLNQILSRHGVRHVTMVTGEGAKTKRLAPTMGIKMASVVSLPGVTTVNEFLASWGPDELARTLRANSSTDDLLKSADPLPDGFVFHRKKHRYEVRGLERSPRVLKATVRVECAGRTHVDTINLYGARVRRRFTHDVARFCDETIETIEVEIERVLMLAETRAGQLQAQASKGASSPIQLTEAERQGAEALARSPNLVDQILDDFDRCGLVGERTSKLLCYLAITSRKLTDPLSVLILASSGAGKSALQEAALGFCPPEDLIKLTSVSGKALFYGERTSLKHKVLAVEEDDGLGAAAYALRSLMSAGELVATTTVRNPANGRLLSVANRVEGPTAVFLTTTSPDIDPETKSRFMVTSVDESREQTRAVLAWQRKQHGLHGLAHDAERQSIVRRHWALQRLLEPVAIVNPFAEQLCFADDRLASRRDQPKYFRLMAAVAFLRQRQKPLKYSDLPQPCAYVEVDEEDVRLANRIATDLFGVTLGELSRPGFELLQLLERMRQEQRVPVAAFRFGRREVREFGRWSHMRVHRYLQELLELEYVELEGRSGRHQYRLRWDGRGLDGERFLIGVRPPEEPQSESLSGVYQAATGR